MKTNKIMKRALALTLTFAMAATSVVVPAATAKKASAKANWTAYLCLQTGKYTYRNNHNDSAFSTKLQNGNGKKLPAAASKATFKNASIKKSGTYTVSLTGLKAGVISKDKKFNTLYIDTNMPSETMLKKVKFSNLVVKFDGKTVLSKSSPVVTPAKKGSDFMQCMAVNIWNKKCKSFKYSMPKKSITMTVKVTLK
jgi:hypothetical protein